MNIKAIARPAFVAGLLFTVAAPAEAKMAMVEAEAAMQEAATVQAAAEAAEDRATMTTHDMEWEMKVAEQVAKAEEVATAEEIAVAAEADVPYLEMAAEMAAEAHAEVRASQRFSRSS